MAADIVVTPIGFKSTDGKTMIHAVIWSKAEFVSRAGADKMPKPKGIIQIAHGMAEYIERYDEFARYLAEQDFVVCGHDHVGHGQSVASPEDWGKLPMGQAKNILIDDVHELRKIVAGRYAQKTPYIIFGHSMGSFVVRCYLARYAKGLSGAIVCGTGNVPSAISSVGKLMCRTVAVFKGKDHKSPFIDGMAAGGYAKHLSDAKTPLDWLSYNEENVARYIADPACGFMFTVSAYEGLMGLTEESSKQACAAKYPKDLPVLVIAGDADPVGESGKGPKACAETMQAAGMTNVTLKIYENMRHEILNEDNRAQVFADIAAFCTTCVQ